MTTESPISEAYTIADDEATRSPRARAPARRSARWRDPFDDRGARGPPAISNGLAVPRGGSGRGDDLGLDGRARSDPTGSVLSTDVDLRFHGGARGQHRGPPARHHPRSAARRRARPRARAGGAPARRSTRGGARAHDRGRCRPGGWLVVEEADMRAFEAQPLPEPLGCAPPRSCAWLRRAAGVPRPELRDAPPRRVPGPRARRTSQARRHRRDDAGGEDSAEWWFLAIEHVRDRLVDAGAFDPTTSTPRSRWLGRRGSSMLGPTVDPGPRAHAVSDATPVERLSRRG